MTIEEASTHTVPLRLPEEFQAYVLIGPQGAGRAETGNRAGGGFS